MIERLHFSWQRVVRLVMAFESVRAYLLRRAYWRDACEQFPGLRQTMCRVWLTASAISLGSIAIARSRLFPRELMLLLAGWVLFLFWQIINETRQLRHQEYELLQVYAEHCQRSRFLNRKPNSMMKRLRRYILVNRSPKPH